MFVSVDDFIFIIDHLADAFIQLKCNTPLRYKLGTKRNMRGKLASNKQNHCKCRCISFKWAKPFKCYNFTYI